MAKMKIALVVHGRFHAFDLARELLARGHDVRLFTHYPKWAVKRFNLPPSCVRSCWQEGVASRLASAAARRRLFKYPETRLHTWFSRWAASEIVKERWDVIFCWSGVGEETLRATPHSGSLRICHRTSAHIRVQADLLEAEERRVGIPLDRPSEWIIAREQREYDLADLICVPSTFVKDSFLQHGIPSEKLVTIHLGVETRDFRPEPIDIDARCSRILAGTPLQILNVGTFSFRKGMWDLAKVIQSPGSERFQFRMVGPVAPEAEALALELKPLAQFVPPQAQRDLPSFYRQGDIFVLPPIEDGYQMVLAQANGAGLPIITTPNGAGHDLVRDKSGWVLPIRDPNTMLERLHWCDSHREELASMVRRLYLDHQPRSWKDMAFDFEAMCFNKLGMQPQIGS